MNTTVLNSKIIMNSVGIFNHSVSMNSNFMD